MALALASRLALREVRRRPGRTLLVALLVAIPTIAIGGAAIIASTARNTPVDNYRAHYGDADIVVEVGGPSIEGSSTGSPTVLLQGARNAFGDTTRIASISWSSLSARASLATAGLGQRSKHLMIHTADLRDPQIAPLYDLQSGRAPAADGEVAISTKLARTWNLQPGDTLTLARPSASATVVGIVRDRTDYGWTGLIGLPGNAFALPENQGRSLLLVDTPRPVSHYEADLVLGGGPNSGERGVYTPDSNEFWDPSGPALLLGAVFTVVGFAVLSIIVTAAFASSARRQLVTIGQLASNGAPRRLVRTSLALQGVWNAVAGLTVAAVALLVGVLSGRSALASVLGRDVNHLRVPVGQLVAIAVVAVLSSTIAAYLPARSATRVSVLDALAGRRPLSSVPRRLLPIGIVAFAAGVGLEILATLGVTGRDGQNGLSSNAFVICGAIGALLILGGMCCASPAIVSVLGPLAHRLRGAARLTARSIARSRPRTAAVVASIAAFAAAGTAASTFVVTARAHSGVMKAFLPDNVVMFSAVRCPSAGRFVAAVADVDPTSPTEPCRRIAPDASISAELDEILPGASTSSLRWATFDPAPIEPSVGMTGAIVVQDPGALLVATPQLLDLMGPSEWDRAQLDRTGIMGWGQPGQWAYAMTGTTDADVLDLILRTRSGDVPVRAAVNRDAMSYYQFGGFIITEAKAAELGMPLLDAGSIYTLPHKLSEAQRVELSFFAYGPRISGSIATLPELSYSSFRPEINSGIIEAAIALGVLAITLLIVAIGLSLNAAEGKDERDVLVSIGAKPGTLSSLSALRAFVLSAFGVLLAIPVGLVPSIVVIHASQAGEQQPEGPVVPWLTIVLLLCIPFAAYCVARVSSSIGRRIRPVRMSAFAFD